MEVVNQLYLTKYILQKLLIKDIKHFYLAGELIGGNVKYWLLQTLANEEQFAEYTAKDGHKYKKVTMQGKEKIIQDMKDRFFLYDNDDYRIVSYN